MSTGGDCFFTHVVQDRAMAIGKRIEQRLEALEWKQRDLIERVEGLTPQALWNLIKRDSVRSEWDVEIAKALQCSVMWLVYGVEDAPYQIDATPSQVPSIARARDAADEIAELVRTMTLKGQWITLGEVRQLAKQYQAQAANSTDS
jgi:hypothetical protein